MKRLSDVFDDGPERLGDELGDREDAAFGQNRLSIRTPIFKAHIVSVE